MAKVKTWKAGQCVTINGKTYRIEKSNDGSDCANCAFSNLEATVFPCNKCCNEDDFMQHECHLTRIWTSRDFNMPHFEDIEDELEGLDL